VKTENREKQEKSQQGTHIYHEILFEESDPKDNREPLEAN
jgi:hypothetical protein